MDAVEIKYFIEAALLAAGRPLSIDYLQGLFDGRMTPEKSEIRQAIAALGEDYANRGIVISEVASGYRQPITRGEIEEVRGVSVSSNIMRTLIERDWARVVGHRDVPGRPEMFGTTKGFLDYFGLKKLDDLPPLADLSDWESLRVQLDLPEVEEDTADQAASIPNLPVLYPEIDEEEVEDGSALMSDAEIDAVNKRIPDLMPVEDADDEDQDASASGG